MRSGLASDILKNDKVERGWNPENDIKDQRAKKFREHNLPVAYWRSHERLNRAEFKFFREQAHGDKRKNQDKRKPEEDRVKKRFLHRVLDLALVHERNLKIKINSSNEQEENENNIGDRQVKIAADFARKEIVKLTHGYSERRCRSSTRIYIESECVISTNTSSSVARRWVSSRTLHCRVVASRKISSRTSAPDSTRNEKIFQSPSESTITSRTPEIFFNSSAPLSAPTFASSNTPPACLILPSKLSGVSHASIRPL